MAILAETTDEAPSDLVIVSLINFLSIDDFETTLDNSFTFKNLDMIKTMFKCLSVNSKFQSVKEESFKKLDTFASSQIDCMTDVSDNDDWLATGNATVLKFTVELIILFPDKFGVKFLKSRFNTLSKYDAGVNISSTLRILYELILMLSNDQNQLPEAYNEIKHFLKPIFNDLCKLLKSSIYSVRKIVILILPLFIEHIVKFDTELQKKCCNEVWIVLKSISEDQQLHSIKTEIPMFFTRLIDVFLGVRYTKQAPTNISKTKNKKKVKKREIAEKFKTAEQQLNLQNEEEASIIDFNYSFTGEILLDVRFEPYYFEVIQDGIRGTDPLAYKYAVFLLKKIVDFTLKYGKISSLSWTKYFSWKENSAVDSWKEFFVLLEIIREAPIHIVEPALKKLSPLMSPGSTIHSSWIILVLIRAFSSPILAVRKKSLEFFLSYKGEVSFVKDNSFLKIIFVHLDQPFLYYLERNTGFVSPFGELVRSFIKILLSADNSTEEDRIEYLKCIMKQNFDFQIGKLFIYEGVLDSEEIKCLNSEDVQNLFVFTEEYRGDSIWNITKTKIWFQYLALNLIIKFSDTENSEENLILKNWIRTGFAEKTEDGIEVLKRKLSNLICDYLLNVEVAENPRTLVTAYILLYSSFEMEDEVIKCVLATLRKCTSHYSYMQKETKQSTVLILTQFLEILPTNRINNFMALFKDMIQSLSSFLIDEIIEESSSRVLDVTLTNTYISLLKSFLMQSDINCQVAQKIVLNLKLRSLPVLKRDWSKNTDTIEKQLAFYGSFYLLALAFELANFKKMDLDYLNKNLIQDESFEFLLQKIQLVKVFGFVESGHFTWNDIQSFFTVAQFTSLHSIYSINSLMENYRKVFQFALDNLLVSVDATAPKILELLSIVAKAVITNDGENVFSVFSPAVIYILSLLQENWVNVKIFNNIYKYYVDFCFQEFLFEVLPAKDDENPIVKSFEIIKNWSEFRPHLMIILAKKILNHWDSPEKRIKNKLSSYKNIFGDFLLFGNVNDLKMQDYLNLKLTGPMQTFLSDEGIVTMEEMNELASTESWNFAQKDYTVRIRANVRLWNSIHVVLDFVSSEERGFHIAELILQSIKLETIQSIRFYCEWALMRISIKYYSCCSLLWKNLSDYTSKANFTASLLSTSIHIGHWLEGKFQLEYYERYVPALLPWLSSNNFVTRSFSQFALKLALTYCDKHENLKSVVKNMNFLHDTLAYIESGGCNKFIVKCEENYFLSPDTFEPLKHVNCEFIFSMSMKVFGILNSERIPSICFKKLTENCFVNIPLEHPENWKVKSISSSIFGSSERQTTDTEDITNTAQSQQPVQQKIVPWEALMKAEVDLSMERHDRKFKKRNQIIIVASLLEKIPNLGGLCRTAEIFNAENLVVSNLSIRDDPRFLNTSVTAEKWQPMSEVKEADLGIYLLKKKAEGYSLCGLEQVTNSISLEKFNFPEKICLILGKEKEGIPATILPLCDFLLQIPQFGVIRSLNVHVSASLVIWQYVKSLL
ncbi:Tar (HIV-1) RNA binding protein 1 [Clydaea vesicula]|uniref:Tar (HIV-1) RNA binding protein 1 n=1 Tax=Clydaea vesicula TaxID=447962 RepID=A0AAD5TYI9_9FUNG|nr:Tar (HIV-1) RNA binding protein 1 [Clydaea vesicula]